QDVVRRDNLAEPGQESAGVRDGSARDDKALEVVVVVARLEIVVRGPACEIVLGGGVEPQQQRRCHHAVTGGDQLGGRAHLPAEPALDRVQRVGRQQVRLIEHHEIGGQELVLEYLLQRIVVV